MAHPTKIVSLLLFTLPLFAYAQLPDPTTKEIDEYVRVKHDRSQSLPNGIAFLETLRLLKIYNDDNPKYAVDSIVEDTGWNEADSQAFLAQALITFNNLNSDIQASTVNLACEFGVISAYGDDVYTVLSQMDDTREAIANQYYQETKDSLSKEAGVRFERWISNQKRKIVHIKFDHKKADQATGRDSIELLSNICEGVK